MLRIAVGLFYKTGSNYGILKTWEVHPGSKVELGAKQSGRSIHRKLESTEGKPRTQDTQNNSGREIYLGIIFPLCQHVVIQTLSLSVLKTHDIINRMNKSITEDKQKWVNLNEFNDLEFVSINTNYLSKRRFILSSVHFIFWPRFLLLIFSVSYYLLLY